MKSTQAELRRMVQGYKLLNFTTVDFINDAMGMVEGVCFEAVRFSLLGEGVPNRLIERARAEWLELREVEVCHG